MQYRCEECHIAKLRPEFSCKLTTAADCPPIDCPYGYSVAKWIKQEQEDE